MLKQYKKITVGFVIQEFERKENVFICKAQNFVAGDQVDYEDYFGDTLSPEKEEEANIATSKECYQPFHMEQPTQDFYYVQVWGLVEIQVEGPFETAEKRDKALDDKKHEDGEEKHIYDTFELPKGTEINL